MHWASLSVSERFLYTEKIDPKSQSVLSYVFDFKLQKFTPIAGQGVWFPLRDMLIASKDSTLFTYDPLTQNTCPLATLPEQATVIDLAVSPDERHLSLLASTDLSEKNRKLFTLYSLDLQTANLTVQDEFTGMSYWKEYHQPKLSWQPDSRYVYYYGAADQNSLRPKPILKRADPWTNSIETSEEAGFPSFSHVLRQSFPSFSPDMSQQIVHEEHPYVLDARSGMRTSLEAGESLTDIHWAPNNRAFVAVMPGGPIAAGPDSSESIRLQEGSRFFLFPALPYAKHRDNFRFIGWSRDGKFFYVADLAEIPYEWY
ncbi:hypothetical protein ACTID9_14090 [Brevibacillus fluminis]|uniref:hypothetical protein n=1 Tax=Brevibacillus fluminis TaxID=511487 RepID=UPI003F8A8908